MSKLNAGKKLAKGLYDRASGFGSYLSDRAWLAAHPSKNLETLRIASVSDGGAYTSEQQLHPFDAYRKEIRSRLGIAYLGLQVPEVLLAPRRLLASFDVVFLKLGFRTPAHTAVQIAQRIRDAVGPQKKIFYFDGDDDVGVQWPAVLDTVDLYVKKHVFRDRQQYRTQFVGKNNLTDYVARSFGISFADDPIMAHSQPLSEQQICKVAVGWNVALDEKILTLSRQLSRTAYRERPNDIVCRAGIPDNWLRYLRRDIEPVLNRMGDKHRVIAPTQRVSQDVYLQEMLTSKICVSPFGYGEICWRDFEAVLCGCLLIKPDMGHIETYPDIFRPFETYVPVAWDYSDLQEKCDYFLAHDAERSRIIAAARRTLLSFYETGFMSRLTTLFDGGAADTCAAVLADANHTGR